MELQDLLKLAYETEGLIALLINRADDTTGAPNDIQRLLIDKVDELHKATYGLMFTINDAPSTASAVHSVIDDTTADEHEDDDEEDVAPEEDVIPAEEDVDSADLPEDDGIETVEVYDLEDAPADDEADADDEAGADDAPIADAAPTTVDIDFQSEPATIFSVDVEDEIPDEETEDLPRDTTEESVETYDLNSRVFSQKNADDFQKMISLNDWHRFFRELFGKSSVDFNNAIDMIRTMHSYDEAEEYFYGDLGWEADDDNVKDFMALVKLYLAPR